MIRSLFIIALLLLSAKIFGQGKPIIKYYDSSWSPTTKDAAFYYAEFNKEGSLYKATAYWTNPRRVNGKGYFTDTSFSTPRKLLVNYYQDGVTQDSSWYDDNGSVKFAYHYYPTGKLKAVHIYASPDKEIFEGYDESGNRIDNFVYLREAEFPDGASAWLRFIAKNVNTQVPIKNGAPNGTYKVFILFVVDKDGNLIDLKPETNLGFGMEEEAMRVIRNSPRWDPLIYLGKPEKAFRRQPVTFVVSSK